MRHSKHNEHHRDSRDLVRAVLRDSQHSGFRIFRTPDEKKIAKEWAKVTDAHDVTEQISRATAIRNVAARAEENYKWSHPVRAMFDRVGIKDRTLDALRACQANALNVEERASRAIGVINDQSIGGGAKLRERWGDYLADHRCIEPYIREVAENWRKHATHCQDGQTRERAEAYAQLAEGHLAKFKSELKQLDATSRAERVMMLREVVHEHRRLLARAEKAPRAILDPAELRASEGARVMSAREDLQRDQVRARASVERQNASEMVAVLRREAMRAEARGERADAMGDAHSRDRSRADAVAARTAAARLIDALDSKNDREILAAATKAREVRESMRGERGGWLGRSPTPEIEGPSR